MSQRQTACDVFHELCAKANQDRPSGASAKSRPPRALKQCSWAPTLLVCQCITRDSLCIPAAAWSDHGHVGVVSSTCTSCAGPSRKTPADSWSQASSACDVTQVREQAAWCWAGCWEALRPGRGERTLGGAQVLAQDVAAAQSPLASLQQRALCCGSRSLSWVRS